MLINAKSSIRSAAACLLLTFVGAACSTTTAAVRGPDPQDASSSKAKAPAWLPPYSQELTELLAAPVEAEVQLRADPTYPDLARFTFAGEAAPKIPEDLTNYASLIHRTIEQSPRLYVFRVAAEGPHNDVALYGPLQPDEPSLWNRSISQPPHESRALVAAPPPEALRAMMGPDATSVPASSLDALKSLAASSNSPGVLCLLAESALVAGDLPQAQAAVKQALELDPFFPAAHRLSAEIAWAKKDLGAAQDSLARALALYPKSPRAWKLASAILGRDIRRAVGVTPPFIEVNTSGAIVVVSGRTAFAERYAACKAAFRFEPELRAAILAQGATVPYHLSVTEEVACLEAGLGSYLATRRSPKSPFDPNAEALIRLARERGLSSFALFEIIGMYRPDVLRTAPLAVHEALVKYVKTTLFSSPAPSPPMPTIAPSPGVPSTGPTFQGDI